MGLRPPLLRDPFDHLGVQSAIAESYLNFGVNSVLRASNKYSLPNDAFFIIGHRCHMLVEANRTCTSVV